MLSLSTSSAVYAQAAEDAVGTWEGSLTVPTGQTLRLVLHITMDDEGVLSVLMDSPDQGASDIPMDSASLEDGIFTTSMAQIGAKYEAELTEDKMILEGEWMQGGQSFDLFLTKQIDEDAE